MLCFIFVSNCICLEACDLVINTNFYGLLNFVLQEEKLDGDNQYYCTHCNGKQNAARYIELHSLPPVLNLQLLRFVFDR